MLADAYIILSEDLRVVYVNESYLSLTHTTSSQVIGRSIFEINDHAPTSQREARNAVMRDILTGLKHGQPQSSEFFRFDLPHPSAPNAPRFWKIKASVVKPASQPGLLYAVRLTDVTRRVEKIEADQREKARLRSQAQLRRVVATEAQTKLQESLERFGQVLDFAKVGAWELDFATGEINCTDQCKLNVGLDVTERLNEHRLFTELIDPADSARVYETLTEAVRNRRAFEVEYRLQKRNRPQQWTMVGGHPHYDESGFPTRMTGFTLDITSRKLVEIEHQEIADFERQGREASEHYARAMDHFLAAVTHELRSPISVIITWTSVLERARDLSHAAQAAATIQRNAKQLALMVDDLLDTAAIVSGKLKIRPSTVQLDVLVADIVSDLKSEVERKGLVLIEDGLSKCAITGDESRIKQIVWNLMTNAIKFTDSGHIVASLECRGGEAILSICDTGRGIEPTAIDKIFERFEQIRPDQSGRVGGLGLGLWLVKNLVEQHAGRIEVHSAGLGHGSRFRVFFPLTA